MRDLLLKFMKDKNAEKLIRTGSVYKISAIPSTMRAAVYRGINDVRVETIPVPEIGTGEVLVKIHTCGICGTDLKKIHTGSHDAPRIFGHEMSGTIVRVGEGVSSFAVGDRVMAYHHIPCGECYYCRKQTFAQCDVYKKVGCTAGFTPSGGGFAEYIRVMDWIVRRGLVKIPDEVSFEQAAFLEPVNTCYKAIQLLNLQPEVDGAGDWSGPDRRSTGRSAQDRRNRIDERSVS